MALQANFFNFWYSGSLSVQCPNTLSVQVFFFFQIISHNFNGGGGVNSEDLKKKFACSGFVRVGQKKI